MIWTFIAIFDFLSKDYPLCDTHSTGAVVCVSVTESVCVQGRVSSLSPSCLHVYMVLVVGCTSVLSERSRERLVLGIVVLCGGRVVAFIDDRMSRVFLTIV